jgi:hypothetical protein
VAKKRSKPRTSPEVPRIDPEVPRGAFVPTERFSFDMLEEVPRQHVIDTLLLYAKAMAVPPKWAVDRWSQTWPKLKKDGHPNRNVLVDKIRSLAVIRCANRYEDKYELAEKLLKSVPIELFCGLSVNASASAIKKSYLAILGRGRYDQNMFRLNTEWLLGEYLPLLFEALNKADH